MHVPCCLQALQAVRVEVVQNDHAPPCLLSDIRILMVCNITVVASDSRHQMSSADMQGVLEGLRMI